MSAPEEEIPDRLKRLLRLVLPPAEVDPEDAPQDRRLEVWSINRQPRYGLYVLREGGSSVGTLLRCDPARRMAASTLGWHQLGEHAQALDENEVREELMCLEAVLAPMRQGPRAWRDPNPGRW